MPCLTKDQKKNYIDALPALSDKWIVTIIICERFHFYTKLGHFGSGQGVSFYPGGYPFGYPPGSAELILLHGFLCTVEDCRFIHKLLQ